MRRRIPPKGIAVAGLLAVVALTCLHAAPAAPPSMADADRLFEQKNYAEAADAYGALVAAGGADWHLAAERVIMSRLRLQSYDEAITAAEDYVVRTAGMRLEPHAERLAGHLYMLLPHWGTRAGGEFYRGEHRQGTFLQSHQHDKRLAVAHMERARDLYAQHDDGTDPAWREERIECLFDLVSLLSQFSIYDDQPQYWHRWWGERDGFLAVTAGEDDFDEGYSYGDMHRKRPIGLRIGPDGEPVFPSLPKDYTDQTPADQKMLYLLDEVRRLDRTEERKHTALSYYRQAMLARKRFGMDRLRSYASPYYSATGSARSSGQPLNSGQPLQEELDSFNPWELEDGEALVLAGGRICKVELPPAFDVLGLLRTVAGDYAAGGVAPEARYAIGLYCQSRQQYTQALAEYEALREAFPESPWAGHAADQAAEIRSPQVQLSDNGVQAPGRPAELQISYRNLDRIHFIARRFDLPAMLREIREEARKETDDAQRHVWLHWQWSHYLVRERGTDWASGLVARHLGPEVARWADTVPNDGTHRYAQATLRSPLTERGAYVVYAFTEEPSTAAGAGRSTEALGRGQSRAVVVLNDLALVEKKTDKGTLCYAADAVTGAPVAGAAMNALETWTTYDPKTRRQTWHTATTDLTTDEHGMAVLPRQPGRGGEVYWLATTPGDRFAWSGMRFSRSGIGSIMREGMFVYLVTDRPVYRPGQTVRFKVWVRDVRNGVPENMPQTALRVALYDPRGDEVLAVDKRTDDFGGLDGEFTLDAEATLGVYTLNVPDTRLYGGPHFRVEEYKKPEFEVTVEPSETHTKLGEPLQAVVKASYYFGAPVTDATVSYRVFREEYRHSYYFPGRWDWLYGPGYGQAWYAHDWFPWWGALRSCWSPPSWWWGYSHYQPVRELVKEGESPIAEDGRLVIDIDTAPALRDHPDRDHRYVVQADVRDASRRVISGEGDVKVTRQAYYAMIQSDRGYYRPGEEMVIRVRCLTPDDRPVQAEGLLTVSRVVFGGPDNGHIAEEELDRWTASTDGQGELSFRLRHERSDQLKIAFAAPDEWGGTVTGYGLVWVCGRDFDGRLYRFNDLELITDKRTYEPGDVCRLMINTRRPDSYVLFADAVDKGSLLSYRLLHLPAGHTVVDVPIKEAHRPNTFVEACLVSDLRVHQQAERICVPPQDAVLNIEVHTDKPRYAPGEDARVRVRAVGPDGEPADVQMVLSAFDRSVLAIQPEYAPVISTFFHGQVRSHTSLMRTNLLERFGAWGYVLRPFESLNPLPPAWQGTWSPQVEGWAWLTDAEFRNLAGGGGIAYSRAMLGGGGGMPKALAAEAADMAEGAPMAAAPAPGAADGGAAEDAAFVAPQVREAFADTAFWTPSLLTGPDGEAEVTFAMPENLTTWKVNAWAVGRDPRVGQASTEAVTTKDLIVRLQAPRFFLEYDEVVLSANVHNYLDSAKTARVSLEVPPEHLALMDGSPATVDVEVAAAGERRVDWRVRVVAEGTAAVTVKALTDEESDAMRMTFPVLVHGMTKQESWCGSMRPADDAAEHVIEFTVPEQRRPELTRLEVQFAPSLVGAMLDALPYCLDYPYGCTEQTVSRFLPAVLTLKTLQNMGIRLEDVRGIRGRMAEVRRIEEGENIRIYADSPIFDSEELQRLIAAGLKRIAEMQHADGGWGWWTQGESSPYLTSYVLQALVGAQECDVAVDQNMIDRGMEFLRQWEIDQMQRTDWTAGEVHAFAAYVLSLKGLKAQDEKAGDCVERLFEGRDRLNLYGKALLSLTLANLNDTERARLVLRNILQYVEQNEGTQIAWFRTPTQGWWYWWNSDIETNAWCLRALVRLEPESEIAPRLVKWLLENRRNGYYWRSTRDTALCVGAMSDFVAATGEGRPDCTVALSLDQGAVVKSVKIDRDNFFTYDNSFVVEGHALAGGPHTLRVSKDGPGALYYSVRLSYFTKEEHITASGLELKIDRTHYLLRRMPYEVEVEGAEGQQLSERRLRYERVPLRNGDRIESGDLVQVELRVTADNDYTYLMFEDMKPAGCEPVELRSGGQRQEGFHTYMELRDEKVAFFAETIGRGEHLLRYRLRAEIPGVFHALPAVVQGMYAPELRGNSDEAVLRVEDR